MSTETMDELIINLIVKDTELSNKLKVKISEALDKCDFTSQIQELLYDNIKLALDDMDLTDAISEPVRRAIAKKFKEAINAK